jgi:hypothetical protein
MGGNSKKRKLKNMETKVKQSNKSTEPKKDFKQDIKVLYSDIYPTKK